MGIDYNSTRLLTYMDVCQKARPGAGLFPKHHPQIQSCSIVYIWKVFHIKMEEYPFVQFFLFFLSNQYREKRERGYTQEFTDKGKLQGTALALPILLHSAHKKESRITKE